MSGYKVPLSSKLNVDKSSLKKLEQEITGPTFGGRKLCNCMAVDHELVGNCLACGKIVCAVEGRGSCLFCGHTVLPKGMHPDTLPDERNFIDAVSHKQKLLEYEKTSEQRLRLIDDQTDWYEVAANPWLSNEAREEAKNLAESEAKQIDEASRIIQVSVDFDRGKANMKIGDKEKIAKIKQEQLEKANSFVSTAGKRMQPNMELSGRAKQAYDFIMTKLSEVKCTPNINFTQSRFNIVQNENPLNELNPPALAPRKYEKKIFKEMDDKRNCLSMHQPWASLLIEGFKRFEGRNWSTEVRGPLWIHAAQRVPTPEEIEAVESQCIDMYNDASERPDLPERYPTGVLLGRIELVDCLNDEEYHTKIPDELREPSECKFHFVVKNPEKLIVPIRMTGGKKIFKLEHDLWDGAKRGLRRVWTSWWPVSRDV